MTPDQQAFLEEECKLLCEQLRTIPGHRFCFALVMINDAEPSKSFVKKINDPNMRLSDVAGAAMGFRMIAENMEKGKA